jgi:hypothetical protein
MGVLTGESYIKTGDNGKISYGFWFEDGGNTGITVYSE